VAAVIEPQAVDAGEHVVGFYGCDADLAGRVGAYLRCGLAAGAVGIVIASERHRELLDARLGDGGVEFADGSLVWLDAAETLAGITRAGRVDREAFFACVGAVVRAAAGSGRPVRAYGEMVALLWEAGDVGAAIELEALWNELAAHVWFSLYCAYPSDVVAAPEHAHALERVCELHTAVVAAAAVDAVWVFACERAAASDARRLVVDALRRGGYHGEILDDARLIVSELAADAVVHSRSAFSVSIRGDDSAVRIRVGDRSPVMPRLREASLTSRSGRSLRLIAALARRWGVERTPDGKAVWAELRL
jgi:anti-sigma regulatory factor (Ser/Thr protein kinase)